MRRQDSIAFAQEGEEEDLPISGQVGGNGSAPPPSLGVFALLVIAFWTALGAFAFHTNQPDNVLTAPWQTSIKPIVQTILPEQWGFFTKSPRDSIILPFRFSKDSRWATAALYPHSQARYFFGLNRVSRAQGVEVGIVYKAVIDSNSSWTDCTSYSNTIECLASLSSAPAAKWEPITNPSPDPTLCGRAALSKAAPAPWAYANIGQTQQDTSVVLVDIACSTN